MRLTILCRILLSTFALLLCATADTYAGSITATLASGSLDQVITPGAWVNINLGDGTSPSVEYYPGKVNWKTNGSSILGPSNTSFTTFCIELTQDVYIGDKYTFTLTALKDAPKPGSSQTGGSSGMGTAKANAIEELWAQDYSAIGTNGNNAAAFQLAIWKIEYDWGDSNYDNFAKGNFQASAVSGNTTPITTAETWIMDVYNHPNEKPLANLVALASPSYQDQLTAYPNPVPPTLYLAGIGGFALILCAWRQRRLSLGAIQG